MRFKMLTFAVAVSFTLPAAAQIVDPVAPVSKKEKKICRNVTETSTRIPDRVCKTSGEWAAQDAQAARDMQDARMDTNRQTSNPSPRR